jgi:fructuronate reductase
MGHQRKIPGRAAGLAGIRRSAGRRCDLYKQRKLWLLNGSHSLLAYAGSICGHGTIDEAIADADAEAGWKSSGPKLGSISFSGARLAAYRSALERFGNRRARHQLSQIAPLHLRGHGAPVKDDAAAAAQAAAADPDLTSAVSGVLVTLDPDFPADPELVETICGRVNVLMSR